MADPTTVFQQLASRLEDLEHQNQQLAATVQALQAPPPPPANNRLKLPQPKQWDGKGDMLANFEIPIGRYLQHHNIHETPAGVDHAFARFDPRPLDRDADRVAPERREEQRVPGALREGAAAGGQRGARAAGARGGAWEAAQQVALGLRFCGVCFCMMHDA